MLNGKLTLNQGKVYIFIKGYILENKRSPYLREIQAACSIKSHKTVIDRLTALERKGYIRRQINRHRSIRLIRQRLFLNKEEEKCLTRNT